MSSMIQTIDLTKKFGDFTANDRINLDVQEKEIKCIVGENGAGNPDEYALRPLAAHQR